MRKFCLTALFLVLSACHSSDRQYGDDPNRSNETPQEGRPIGSSPAQRPADAAPVQPEDGRGTLDGTSDETGSRATPK
jgi:hypothetical protein